MLLAAAAAAAGHEFFSASVHDGGMGEKRAKRERERYRLVPARRLIVLCCPGNAPVFPKFY
jgi:hypothetical protein